MKEVCNFTYQYDQFFSVVNTLYKRMLENNKNAWRRVYKGSKKKTDDDEFGEFTSARGTTAANTSAQPTKSLGRISVPGGSVAKSAPTVQKQHVAAPPPAAVGFDLLGGFDAPATGGSTPAVDLFADPVPSSIPQINTAALRPPRPPSGGSAASNGFSPSQPANLLDDVFGSPVSAAPPANNYSQMSMDPFGSLPSQPSPQQAVQPSFADFGAPATGSQPQTAQKSPTPAKVGRTWSGTTGLIDLNNLGNKNPSKKVHVPMNQMGSRNL
ncbi:unnamed protein product, partial [Mesorhabditis spiculigera]